MPATFQSGTNWQQSSEPITNISVHEADIWPIADNAIAAKDAIDIGLHPVIAIGGRTAADGRPLNVTGVVVSYVAGLVTAEGRVVVNIANGAIVRQYVNNILTYDGGDPNTYEQAPIPGQPVYVDDSAALAAGVTLSMSPLNSGGLRNPVAGHLFYCQDEYADNAQGGPNADPTFDTALPNEETEQEFCVILSNGWRELA